MEAFVIPQEHDTNQLWYIISQGSGNGGKMERG